MPPKEIEADVLISSLFFLLFKIFCTSERILTLSHKLFDLPISPRVTKAIYLFKEVSFSAEA